MFLRLVAVMMLVSNAFGREVEYDFTHRKPKLHEEKFSMKQWSSHDSQPLGIDKIDDYFNEFKSVNL